jgi:cytosine/creatinine deaminase
MDFLVRDANVWQGPDRASIVVDDGRIERITTDDLEPPSSTEVINADGRLVTPTFANPHVHLDQVYTADEHPNVSGTFEEAFETNREVKYDYEASEIAERAGQALEEAARYGNTLVRGFADVDGYAGTEGVEALLECKKTYADVVDLQVCAFAQEGIGEHTHTQGIERLREGMAMGADVAGGIPWIEPSEASMQAHVDAVFDVAAEHDADVHFLVDDTDSPTSRSLEYVATRTLEEGYEGRVAVSHARALAAYDDYHAERVIDLVSRAGIHVCSNMHVVLYLAAHRDGHPIRRGITRVDELLEADVNVAIGQDDASDMWYPFGVNDMLELGWFACHAARLSGAAGRETALEMITTRAAAAMGIDTHGLVEGRSADLVVLDAETVREAFARGADRRWVLKDGRVIAETETTTTLR